MIILKHLTIERFRLLREVNLHFPQRGSILIQGPNEAGKSALFESIYFALYGEPLWLQATERDRRAQSALDDLVHYGEADAQITLTLAIGATELVITRNIERGKGQSVQLSIYKLGIPVEKPITQLHLANQRIIAELGHLDAEALRNSYFIEQKGLTRLENLGSSERDATLHKLLGLEQLIALGEQFKLTEHDEQALTECRQRLKLAELQARIPELSLQLGKVEEALDAVTVSLDLQEAEQQQVEIDEQMTLLNQLQVKNGEIKSRQNRITQLKKADAILAEIIAAYDDLAEAQRELPELERQLGELERRELEELPVLERRVRELTDLSRSFSTLERMAGDLLSAVSTIKELEQELRSQEHLHEDLAKLDEEIIHTRLRVEQEQQAQHELEEQSRIARPQLETRLQRLRALVQNLKALKQAQEQHIKSETSQQLAEQNSVQLQNARQELAENEHELELAEIEAKETQQQVDTVEQRWRQLSIFHQFQEWQRLKGLSQKLVEVEQKLKQAHQQQEQWSLKARQARSNVTMFKSIFIACVVLLVLTGGVSLLLALRHAYIFSALLSVVALLLAVGSAWSLQKRNKVHQEEQAVDRQLQETLSQLGTMVTEREATSRAVSNSRPLAAIEQEIQALGGNVPRSLDEARNQIQQIPLTNESVADIQQQLMDRRSEGIAARNQVNIMQEAVAALHKEVARLEQQRVQEGWEELKSKLSSEQETIERLSREILAQVGQEGLPIPNFASASSSSVPADSGVDGMIGTNLAAGLSPAPVERIDGAWEEELNADVAEAIEASEHEIATLENKLATLPEVTQRVKSYQESLDAILSLKKAATERYERFAATNPGQRIEQARKQQATLREALRLLQDSLRQRVKPLGVTFGQAVINSAEVSARKQLELLQIALGRKEGLQSRCATYTATLKERQESLSEQYQQLAKLSVTLGGWIVPPNPFAEALTALRTRCQREMQVANEMSIQRELEELKYQEGASKAKIELCLNEIEARHESIVAMLARHNRPPVKGYTSVDIIAVWPLVENYSAQDNDRLEEERYALEQELLSLEQQELMESSKLQADGAVLDVEQAHKRMEQQERNYQAKKRSGVLIQTTIERLVRKVLPRTEYYMQQLLPLLTCSRYHDVRLGLSPVTLENRTLSSTTTELSSKQEHQATASDGSLAHIPQALQMNVWEPAAAEYISKSTLSGGTADQISLAFRLAFAIATLPRELGAAPGFLLLDEPLSSFDLERMQALVDIVTGDMLGQHFEQILLISHSSTFDPALFPYHLYIEDGQVIESNLPVVPVSSPANGYSQEMQATVAMQA